MPHHSPTLRSYHRAASPPASVIVLAGGVHCAGPSAFDPLRDTMNAAPTRRPITQVRPCLIRDMLFSRLRGRLIRPYGRKRRRAGPGLAGARAPPVENPPAEAPCARNPALPAP